MVSTLATEKFGFDTKAEMWDHDPNGVAAAVVTPDAGVTERWLDMRDFGGFVFMALASALTGAGITKMEIVAADDVAGTNLVVIKDSGVLAAGAVGDWAKLECLASEVRHESDAAGYASRYVAGRITMANAADEAVVVYLGTCPRFPTKGLTPATTIA